MKQRSRMEILSHRLQLGHTPSLGLLHKDAGNWSTSPLQCKGNSAEEKKVENSGSAISKYKDAQLKGKKTEKSNTIAGIQCRFGDKRRLYMGSPTNTPSLCWHRKEQSKLR